MAGRQHPTSAPSVAEGGRNAAATAGTHTGRMTDPPPAPDCVLLLGLWLAESGRWHVRLVEPDARVHEFDSPFELARFLAQRRRPPEPGLPDGLR